MEKDRLRKIQDLYSLRDWGSAVTGAAFAIALLFHGLDDKADFLIVA